MSSPRVAILYLCYGNLRHLPGVVDAFAHLTYPKDRVTVVFLPAESPDGIADVIARDVLPRAGSDLPACVLMNEPNRGFAANNNIGIQWALDQGFDYVLLNNGDLKLAPEAVNEMVRLAEADAAIGSVQALVRYWHEPEKVNVSGGMVHVAGYGFARDNGSMLRDVVVRDGEDVAYASGAAVLYRAESLRKVGLLEEGFFMYHEDLELGMRLRFAGYRNVLAANAFAFHDYSFSRNPKKFAWMELYRWIVVLSYYRVATLVLIAPLIVGIEAGTWLMAVKGGWVRAKFWMAREWLRPTTWKLLRRMRQRTKRLRVIRDRDFLRFVTGKIEGQETNNPLMERVINPTIDALWRAIRSMIAW